MTTVSDKHCKGKDRSAGGKSWIVSNPPSLDAVIGMAYSIEAQHMNSSIHRKAVINRTLSHE